MVKARQAITVTVRGNVFKKLGPSIAMKMARIGTEAFRLMHKRVVQSGRNADGGPFPKYSSRWPRKGLLLSLRKAELRRWGSVRGGKRSQGSRGPSTVDRSGRTRAGRRRTGWAYFRSYAEFRQAQGLPTDRLRFNLTGEMWRRREVRTRHRRTGPEIVLSFGGNYQPRMDYGQQKRRPSRGRSYRPASPATKCTAQFALRPAGRGIRFLGLSRSELIYVRDRYWRTSLCKRLRKGFKPVVYK